jgi:transcriptional regulator with XRE-family HTH domain
VYSNQQAAEKASAVFRDQSRWEIPYRAACRARESNPHGVAPGGFMGMSRAIRRRDHQRWVGHVVRRERDALGMSQEELAHRLGTSRREVVRLESGLKPITLDLVEDLATALDVISHAFLALPPLNRPPTDRDMEYANLWAAASMDRRFGAVLEKMELLPLLDAAQHLDSAGIEQVTELTRALVQWRSGEDLPTPLQITRTDMPERTRKRTRRTT